MTEGPDPRFGMEQPLAHDVTVTTPEGLVSATTTTRSAVFFDPNGDLKDPVNVATLTDTVTVNGRAATSVHDFGANQITTTTPEGRSSSTTLDAFGRVSQSQLPGLAAIQYGYDTKGRLETVSQGLRTVTYSYDPDGYLEKATDPLSREAIFDYDLAGRVETQTLPDLRQIGFGYDDNGNLTSITPPGRPAHGFDHTEVDLPEEYTPPAIGLPEHRTILSYNLDRQIDLITRPDGQTIDYVYDSTSGRLDDVVTPRGAYAYTYEPGTGNLSSVSDPDSGSLAYGYDGSLPTSVTWAGDVAGSLELTYNDNFELTERKINGANPLTFAYDDDGLLTGSGSLTLTRDPATGFLSGTQIDTVTDAYGYDPTYGELSSYSASQGGAEFYSVTYPVRDALGRIKQKVETIGGVTDTYDYTYDTAGRLEDVQKNGSAFAHYDYGANSNRESWTGPWGSGSATYDDQDRLQTYGGLSYTYTANGELTSKTDGSATVTYDYDVAGNLRQVVLDSGVTIDYVIDASNRRVGKKVGGSLVKGWLYKDQLNPVAELDGAGTVEKIFVYGSKANVPDYIEDLAAGETYRVISDHLGSVRLVVDSSDGSVVQRLDYGPFGRVMLDTNPGLQPFGFAGGLYDYQTGLVRFGARDYDPETGRWTSKDPIGFAGGDTNLYGYVLGDPMNLTDPNGQIVPLLAAAGVATWSLIEAGLSIYDVIDTIAALLDPCESFSNKAISAIGFGAGLILPGGGYGKAAKVAKRKADDVLEIIVDPRGRGSILRDARTGRWTKLRSSPAEWTETVGDVRGSLADAALAADYDRLQNSQQGETVLDAAMQGLRGLFGRRKGR